MEFNCPNCRLAGSIEDAKLPEQGLFAHCRNCGTRFLVKKEPVPDLAPPPYLSPFDTTPAGYSADGQTAEVWKSADGEKGEPVRPQSGERQAPEPELGTFSTIPRREIEAFIGKNADAYIKRFAGFNMFGKTGYSATWNWPAFLVPFWWFIYRKLYLWAVLAFVISVIPTFGLLSRIVFGLTGNYIYYIYSTKKLQEINALPSERDRTREMLRAGGVNRIVWLLAPLYAVVILSILTAIAIPQFNAYRMKGYNYSASQSSRSSAAFDNEIQEGANEYDKGNYKASEKHFLAAKQLADELPEKDGRRVLILYDLCCLYSTTGDYPEAEKFGLQSVKLAKELLGVNNDHTARAMNNLAEVYMQYRDYKKAEELYMQALKTWQLLFGKNNIDVAKVMTNLGNLYLKQGNYDNAGKYIVESIAIKKSLSHKEYGSIATSLLYLADIKKHENDFEAAERYLMEAIGLRIKYLGRDHPSLGPNYNDIALLYKETGRYHEAAEYFDKSLKINMSALGENHTEVATNYLNMGDMNVDLKQYEKAEQLYNKALHIYEKIYDSDHFNFSLVYGKLAHLCAITNRNAESCKYYEYDLKISKKYLRDDDPNMLVLKKNLEILKGRIANGNR